MKYALTKNYSAMYNLPEGTLCEVLAERKVEGSPRIKRVKCFAPHYLGDTHAIFEEDELQEIEPCVADVIKSTFM